LGEEKDREKGFFSGILVLKWREMGGSAFWDHGTLWFCHVAKRFFVEKFYGGERLMSGI
jgi:hypothetical protein